ncbi:MAG: hypothetical protein DMF69_04875 [Acidobacteria bacterium]|nr:MAG: hypothetical protein DMF69_04875 [Acidobacteriota bacterium]
MSEIKLNLIDSTTILNGTIHGSIGDYCVAALSAEPETIDELVAALRRFQKHTPDFSSYFRRNSELDPEPYDAGILIIDLAARVVARESTYSLPGPCGEVYYHDGQRTDLPIFYRVPDDWLFLDSIEEYECVCAERRTDRLKHEPFDARSVLYGRPLLEFIATSVQSSLICQPETNESAYCEAQPNVLTASGAIHAQWLLTPREDLREKSPRQVLLAKREFIETDLESRARQWSMQLEGPPCLSKESFAYRFAGFGVHEWVLYYDLIRYLLNSPITHQQPHDFQSRVCELELLRDAWLNNPCEELDGRIPAIVIENERKRLPEAMGGRSMVIDEDCPICKMMGDDCEAGLEICFWHLDSSSMDEHFAFSTFETEKEYLEDILERELRYREFDEKWREREARIARGEPVELDPFFDPLPLDEFTPFAVAEPDPPEA